MNNKKKSHINTLFLCLTKKKGRYILFVFALWVIILILYALLQKLSISYFANLLPGLGLAISIGSFILTILISDNLIKINDELEQKEVIEKYFKVTERNNIDYIIMNHKELTQNLDIISDEIQNNEIEKRSPQKLDKIIDEVKFCNKFFITISSYLEKKIKVISSKDTNIDREELLNTLKIFTDTSSIKELDITYEKLIRFYQFSQSIFNSLDSDIIEEVEKRDEAVKQVSGDVNKMFEQEGDMNG